MSSAHRNAIIMMEKDDALHVTFLNLFLPRHWRRRVSSWHSPRKRLPGPQHGRTASNSDDGQYVLKGFHLSPGFKASLCAVERLIANPVSRESSLLESETCNSVGPRDDFYLTGTSRRFFVT